MQNELLDKLWITTGIANFEWGQLLMIGVGLLLLFLAIVKKFEPLLLVPIGFGAILSNIPVAAISGPEGRFIMSVLKPVFSRCSSLWV